VQGHLFLVSRPPLPKAGPLLADLASPASEAPEADESQDGDDAEESEEETSLSTSPPPTLAEDAGVDKKRKRVDEIASSSSAVAGKAPVLVEDMEYFDLLASQVLYSSFSIALFLPCFHNLFSSCRDDEEPPTYATAAPPTSPPAADEPVEPDVAPRATRASVKKVPQARNPKRSKKAK
jgi:hypothetical protein